MKFYSLIIINICLASSLQAADPYGSPVAANHAERVAPGAPARRGIQARGFGDGARVARIIGFNLEEAAAQLAMPMPLAAAAVVRPVLTDVTNTHPGTPVSDHRDEPTA